MSKYELTRAAGRDLAGIAAYTIDRFGIEQARKYRDGLFRAFDTLAAHPGAGRDYSHVKSGSRRYKYESHSIYYRVDDAGVVIQRILHNRQDPVRNL